MPKATTIINQCIGGGKTNYRSDIDGLRALACIAVVIYHAFPNTLISGFTGVDIFFVISGFLISSILYRNLYDKDNPGQVKIVDFYIRRVRRIFPALLAVLAFVLVFGWFALLPDEYKRLGKHVFGGSTFISNFMLYNETGDYFNVDSNLKPLLHLWSLGVEEQFYLIFPIFLWGLYRLKLNLFKWLLIFTSVSFFVNLYCIWASNSNHILHLPNLNIAFVLDKTGNSSYAFYMPWTRFWELSSGAVLAYLCMFKTKSIEKIQTKKIANILSIIGVVLIILGYFKITNMQKFPGNRALVPVLGALLIIAAGKRAFINSKILSSKIFIFLGLISYPLYLWHWPLLSIAYICNGEELTAVTKISLIVLSILLATFTFYFIEPPLRYGSKTKLKAISLFLVLLVVGGLGSTVYAYKGFTFRGAVTIDGIDLNGDDFNHKYYSGFNSDIDESLEYAKGKLPGDPEFLLTGDSFAYQYAPYFEKTIPYERVFRSGIFCYKYMCVVVRDGWHLKVRNSLLNRLENYDTKNVMIVQHYWGRTKAEYQKVEDSYLYLADTFKNTHFYLVGMLPRSTTSHNWGLCYATLPLRSYLSKKDFCERSFSLDEKEEKLIELDNMLKDIANKRINIHYIDPKPSICNANTGRCKVYDEKGRPIFSDTEHLTIWGRELIAPYILNEFHKIHNNLKDQQ